MTGSARRAEAPGDPTLAGRTVLVIEDHRDSRELLTSVLQSLRAHVITATTVEDAEHEVSLHRPHLIICDMRLPDGSGLDFIRWLRVQSNRIKKTACVAVTGWEQVFPPERVTGFDAYMRKPIDLDRFCDVVVALARP